jgi:acyl-CoA thioesterase I
MKHLTKKSWVLTGFVVVVQCLHGQDSTHSTKPVFSTTAVSRIALNEVYHYQFTADDPAGLPLLVSVSDLPGWLAFDPVTNTVSGKAIKAGQYPVHIEISDTHDTARQNFMLTVYDGKTTDILCLGNSLTNGTNKYNSYRRDLWQLLHKANYDFDFIGSWNKHHGGGEMPNDDFDTDHDGHSGWTIDNMFHPPGWDSARGNITQWLTRYQPAMVLIELGTNDVFQCVKVSDMISKMDRLVQTLRQANNTVLIFIAQIPPLGQQWAPKKLCGIPASYDAVVQDLNKQIGLYAVKWSTKTSPVHAVDQFTGVDPSTDMYDDIHPNDKGEKIMAQRWFDAIHGYLKKLP